MENHRPCVLYDRECIGCGRRFTTFERIEENPVMVVKRDGRREPFEREKVAAGIRKACEKRPIPADVQNRLVDEIAREINNSLDSEVTTEAIGELVMKKLKDVSYTRWTRSRTSASRASTASSRTHRRFCRSCSVFWMKNDARRVYRNLSRHRSCACIS